MTRKLLSNYALLFMLLILFSCNQGNNSKDSTANYASAEIANLGLDSLNSPHRKIIHTADINCKVNDVLKATILLEQYTKSLNGIVSESTITNRELETRSLPYTADSLKEVKNFQRSALLRLRVPAQFRDSLINLVPAFASFVDSRQLLQSDATLQYLSNDFKANAGINFTQKAESKTKKSSDYLAIANREEKNIDHVIEKYKIEDATSFATITINIYQPVQSYSSTIVNSEAAMRTPFSATFKEALRKGLYLLEKIIAAFVTLWPVWFLILAGFYLRTLLIKRRIILFKK